MPISFSTSPPMASFHERSPIAVASHRTRRDWLRLHVPRSADAVLAFGLALGAASTALRADDGGPLLHARTVSRRCVARSAPASQPHLVRSRIECRAWSDHDLPGARRFSRTWPPGCGWAGIVHRRCSPCYLDTTPGSR